MTKLLQSIFIFILNPVYVITGRISDRTRAVIIQILCFCFPVFFVLRHAGVLYSRFSLHETGYQIVGASILLLLIVFSINAPLKHIIWRKVLIYPVIITGICIIIISFLHTIGSGYRMFGLMLIIIYPCLFFVWNNRSDYNKLFVPLSFATCIIGTILFLYCLYQANAGAFIIIPGGRCAGPLGNPNSLSMMGAIVFCAALYLLVYNSETKLTFLFSLISLGAGSALVFLGQSRISIAVCVVNLLVAIFFYLRYCRKTDVTRIIIKGIILFNILLISLFASQCLVALQHASETTTAANTTSSTQPSVQQQYTHNSAFDRFDANDSVDMNSFSSGRIIIWKSYAQQLNLLGNDYYSTDWNKIDHDPSYHAHNNFLEMAYRFGIPVGALYILLEIIAGLIALQYLFLNRQKDITLLFPILIMIMFAFESMLEVATMTFERITPCYFYLALIPMVDASINKKQNDGRG